MSALFLIRVNYRCIKIIMLLNTDTESLLFFLMLVLVNHFTNHTTFYGFYGRFFRRAQSHHLYRVTRNTFTFISVFRVLLHLFISFNSIFNTVALGLD
jgi:hypothetical protein